MVARRASLLACLTFVLAGCWWAETGSAVFAVNDWDQDVIVRIDSSVSGWKAVPAHTWSILVIASPLEDSRFTVFDRFCRVLSELPFTSRSDTLRVSAEGVAEILEAHPSDLFRSANRVDNYENSKDAATRCRSN